MVMVMVIMVAILMMLMMMVIDYRGDVAGIVTEWSIMPFSC